MLEEDVSRAESRVGTVLAGKWTLERLLGVGGMAAVYAARHRIGSQVAIKILHPDVARSKELRARFEREARVANTLKHPGAVEVRDVDIGAGDSPFMVMELLDGEPLSERLRRNEEIPTPDLLRYTDELLDVLAAAHAQGIIHRDIKLDNLFVTRSGSLKVLDFGIARLREGVAMTLVGARLGTLPYMPPEQMRGIPIDGRADLFAVGAVLYRLIAKRRIHEARSEAELIAMMTTTPAPALAMSAPDAPPDLCLVVDRALAFDRDRRYPDAQTMQEDVKALRRGEHPPYATRKLAETGPPNPAATDVAGLGPLPTRAATPEAIHGPAEPTSATRVGNDPPHAVVSTGQIVNPLEPTASGAVVGTGEVVSALEPTAAAPGPASATAAATPFGTQPMAAFERTALSEGQPNMQRVERTVVSTTGGAGATMMSAGMPPVGPTVPAAPNPPTGYQPPPQTPTPPGSSWVALTIGGAVLLFVVVAIAWVLSGDDDDEIDTPAPTAESTAIEKPDDSSGTDTQRASDDPVQSPVSPARPLPGRTTPPPSPAPAEPPPPGSPVPPAPQVTPTPAPAPAPGPAPEPALPAPAPAPTPPDSKGPPPHPKGKGF